MLPVPSIARWITRFHRVLIITTLEGYEGTGNGLLHRMLNRRKANRWLSLDEPLRWCVDDPLARFVEKFLNPISDYHPLKPSPVPWTNTLLLSYSSDPLAHRFETITQIYQLLRQGPYRTTPKDLRRLDDPSSSWYSLITEAGEVVAVLWPVKEGELAPALAQAVTTGIRRPKGNLVIQSLVPITQFIR